LLNADELLNNRNTDLPYTEAKTEVVIDRIKGTATPRQIERVPAGVEFEFEIIFNVWNSVSNEMFVGEEEGLGILSKGMGLLEMDYLGGKGSRGSGHIKFIVNKVIIYDLVNEKEINNDYLQKYFHRFL
ncbi:MAG: type III-A CRISPR-associated RAMP protein Csm3, partial [Thermoplasmata archaeon]